MRPTYALGAASMSAGRQLAKTGTFDANLRTLNAFDLLVLTATKAQCIGFSPFFRPADHDRPATAARISSMNLNATGMLYTCAVRDHEGAITWTRVLAENPGEAATEALANLAMKGRCVVDVYAGDRRTPVDPRLAPAQTVTLIA